MKATRQRELQLEGGPVETIEVEGPLAPVIERMKRQGRRVLAVDVVGVSGWRVEVGAVNRQNARH